MDNDELNNKTWHQENGFWEFITDIGLNIKQKQWAGEHREQYRQHWAAQPNIRTENLSTTTKSSTTASTEKTETKILRKNQQQEQQNWEKQIQREWLRQPQWEEGIEQQEDNKEIEYNDHTDNNNE